MDELRVYHKHNWGCGDGIVTTNRVAETGQASGGAT
jgi:hypothetical protein